MNPEGTYTKAELLRPRPLQSTAGELTISSEGSSLSLILPSLHKDTGLGEVQVSNWHSKP